jgi:hypothetical protein
MIKTHSKQLVTLLLILLAVLAVALTTYTGNNVQARRYCSDPCDPYCWGT